MRRGAAFFQLKRNGNMRLADLSSGLIRGVTTQPPMTDCGTGNTRFPKPTPPRASRWRRSMRLWECHRLVCITWRETCGSCAGTGTTTGFIPDRKQVRRMHSIGRRPARGRNGGEAGSDLPNSAEVRIVGAAHPLREAVVWDFAASATCAKRIRAERMEPRSPAHALLQGNARLLPLRPAVASLFGDRTCGSVPLDLAIGQGFLECAGRSAFPPDTNRTVEIRPRTTARDANKPTPRAPNAPLLDKTTPDAEPPPLCVSLRRPPGA